MSSRSLLPVADKPAGRRRAAIRAIAAALMQALGLRDVFSMDFRVEADDTVHLIEFEVCPGLPCFDFRAYCRAQWGMSLADAMAETAASRLIPEPTDQLSAMQIAGVAREMKPSCLAAAARQVDDPALDRTARDR